MYATLKIKSGLIARGRNGLFTPDSIEVFAGDDWMHIEIFSKRRGNTAPIIIRGTRGAIQKLTEELAHKTAERENNKND